jgi:glyoxylase-like metal-dependent hydrolase (beta-lactamase superfamily II)
MLKRSILLTMVAAVFVLAVLAAEKPKIPVMKFDEVAELAPGVFFRYSSISATDKRVPFGGSNNSWIVFKDHVVVVDANFPKEAGDVLAAIRKTTDKPIKYVLDTHHHGDHAYGNCIWAKEGARIVAHADAARLLKTSGPKQWADASKARRDIRDNDLKTADIPFDDKYVLDDGTQRVEFLHFGHSHTIGDAVAYLPKHKILCTGDACVNGAFNYTGHSNTESWVRCLEKMEQLDIELVCPGHGAAAGKELLGKQKRYFVELRQAVKNGIAGGQGLAAITAGIDLPWYQTWTGVPAKERTENVQHVYDELNGKVKHELLGMQTAPLDYRSAEPTAVAARRRP